MTSRFHPLRLLYALAAAGVMSHAGAQGPNLRLTAQEELLRGYFASRNLTSLLLLSERRGQILMIENGQVTTTIPVITGKTKGDEASMRTSVTPAGGFPLKVLGDASDPAAPVAYYPVGNTGTVYTIHTVVKGREAMLATGTPAQKRMSDGCINVFPADLALIAAFTQRASQRISNPDGSPGLKAPFLVILPESANLGETRKFFGIPQSFNQK